MNGMTGQVGTATTAHGVIFLALVLRQFWPTGQVFMELRINAFAAVHVTYCVVLSS